MLQQAKQAWRDFYRLACGAAVQVRDLGVSSVKAKLIFKAIYFIERLFACGAKMSGIVTMQHQLEASGHRVAGEGDARHAMAKTSNSKLQAPVAAEVTRLKLLTG